MCLRRELSPPLLCATKYVHALRGLVNGHPGLPSPGQTWSSPANFRNDSGTQLLLSHWRRGRVGEGREEQSERGCVWSVGRGACDIGPSPLRCRPAGLSALPPGRGPCDPRPRVDKVLSAWVLRRAPWELMGQFSFSRMCFWGAVAAGLWSLGLW